MRIFRRKNIITGFVFIFIISAISCSYRASLGNKTFERTAKKLLITNTNVLSADGTFMRPLQNVLLENGKISKISSEPIFIEQGLAQQNLVVQELTEHGGAEQIFVNQVEEIDGRGKYVIPGLIDSHVHLQNSPADLLVYIAHGVTFIREMSGNETHLNWQAQIKNGRVGPAIEVSSEKISSKSGVFGFINSLFWNRINISTPEQAETLVNNLINEGYTNAKISSDINKPMYLALAEISQKRQLQMIGHIPQTITINELIDSGQAEIAHIEELVKKLNQAFGYFTTDTTTEFIEYVNNHSDALAKLLYEHQVAVNTSLWYMQSIPKQITSLESLVNDIDLSFTNPDRVKKWLPGNNSFEQNHAHLAKWWPTFVEANEIILRALVRNNVIILAGTDAMTSMVIPGLSLHQELEALVQTGMSPSDALHSATIIPAKWMKEKVGKIAEGYKADLLILEANPIENIKNTQKINAVISAGRLYDKSTVTQMLNQVREGYK